MPNKKAALDVSFNWIFVLIAGAAILIFFMVLISSQKDRAEANIALTLKTNIKSVFSGASLSQDRQLDIDLPKVNLVFTCDYSSCSDFSISNSPTCYSQYEIGETGINEQTGSQIIFSPIKVSGKKLFTWTLPWNVPFFVTNFLFVSGTNSHYIFIDSSNSEILTIFNTFPEKMNKELLPLDTLSSYAPGGSSNIKLIFVDYDIESLSLPDSLISATSPDKINAINIISSSQVIDFYYFENDRFYLGESLPYLDDAEIYAAIFSDNIEFYKCNMQKAMNRYHIITEVIQSRSNSLYNHYSATSCQTLYADYANGLQDIYDNTYIFSTQNINLLAGAIPTLQSANQAAKEKSCPQIY